MAVDGSLISLLRAFELMSDRLSCTLPIESVLVSASFGRIVRDDILAVRLVPEHANSAVDGYGFRLGDVVFEGGEAVLRVVGSVRAGCAYEGVLGSGEALRVLTGAAIDLSQIDVVVMEESVCVDGAGDGDGDGDGDGAVIRIKASAVRGGMNLRYSGDDVEVGDILVRGGSRLDFVHVGLLSGQGIERVEVYKRLRVGLFSSGDELRDSGSGDLSYGEIYDTNRPMLLDALRSGGYDVEDYGILGDSESEHLALLGGSGCDCVVASAGMSLSEEDHLGRILSDGGDLCFWRLLCKPGRPTGLGFFLRESDGYSLPIFGLGGNPVAAFTMYGLLCRYGLKLLSGESASFPLSFRVRMGEDLVKKVGRREFVRCRLESGGGGDWLAYRCGKVGAGVLSSISLADGLLDLPESCGDLVIGDEVSFISLRELLHG